MRYPDSLEVILIWRIMPGGDGRSLGSDGWYWTVMDYGGCDQRRADTSAVA